MKNSFITLFSLFFTITVYTQTGTNSKLTNEDLLEIKNLMTGFFSTEAHSIEDTSYFHIRLCMHPIWEERHDGHWLYVEQAAFASMDKPYRQRVYHLFLNDDSQSIVSRVYEIENPAPLVGSCNNPSLLSNLKFENLIPRPGCELFLSRTMDMAFVGSTLKGACLSSWRGASWVSSDVSITTEGLTSWDRGWDAENNHIWGPENGGYRFEKID
jgi:CpeT protein